MKKASEGLQQNRFDHKDEAREDWQDWGDDAREDRQKHQKNWPINAVIFTKTCMMIAATGVMNDDYWNDDDDDDVSGEFDHNPWL